MTLASRRPPQPRSPALRWALLIVGFVAVGLAVAGIFMPVLPTVPFLLLAMACFARSSRRFYTWLFEHAHLGPIVRPYLQGRGISRSSRRKAIALLWASIAVSMLFLLKSPWLRGLLLIIACGVSLYLLRLPTFPADNSTETD